MAKPKILVIVTSDPRRSARPAEAIRIAAGVAAWGKADFTLYFQGPAILALGEWVDELVDDDNFTRYLPILTEGGGRLLVEAGSPFIGELGESVFRFEPIALPALASIAAEQTHVLRF